VTEPASTYPSSVTGVSAKSLSRSSAETWFRTREGHRYGVEIGLIILVKLALLVVLWFVFIKPWPRPETPPATVVQQLYLPAMPAARND
jgi:hypothetical protein